MPQVSLTVNGKQHTVEVEGRTLLVELLREKLGLTGTHVGCDTSQCGACVVQDLSDTPSTCTTQAPHWLVSQPTCVPVSPSFSRSNSTSRVRASTSTDAALPFTVRVTCGMALSRVRSNRAVC